MLKLTEVSVVFFFFPLLDRYYIGLVAGVKFRDCSRLAIAEGFWLHSP